MHTTEWWTLPAGSPKRAAAKLATERELVEPTDRPASRPLHPDWVKVAGLDGGIAELEHAVTGEHAYRGGSGWVHRFTDECSRRRAYLHAQSPWRRWPPDLLTWMPLPGFGFALLTHRLTRASAVVLSPTFASLRCAITELNPQVRP
jgi:hypothetical protein